MVPAGRHRATPPASFRRRAHPILTTRPSPTSGTWLTAAPGYHRLPVLHCSRGRSFSAASCPQFYGSWSGQPTPRHLPIPAPCRTCVTILTTADSNQRTNQCVPVPVSSHGRSFSAASCPDPLWSQIHSRQGLRAPRCCSRPAVHTHCRTVVAIHPPTPLVRTHHVG